MKVTVDNLLNSARKINRQRQPDDQSPKDQQKEIKTDSVKIENRVMSRLDGIQKEIRDIQSTLTRNQIIQDGILQLKEDWGKGGLNRENIMDQVTFQHERVLRDFVGEGMSGSILNAKHDQINQLINGDVSRLKKLHVEVENIMASNLTDSGRLEDSVKKIEQTLARSEDLRLSSISHLKADSVMRLIK